jgi:hypothetical protein
MSEFTSTSIISSKGMFNPIIIFLIKFVATECREWLMHYSIPVLRGAAKSHSICPLFLIGISNGSS